MGGMATAHISARSASQEATVAAASGDKSKDDIDRIIRLNKRLAEDVEFRLNVLNRRVRICEDRHLNPMVGRSRTMRAYDALTAAPLPAPEARPPPPQP